MNKELKRKIDNIWRENDYAKLCKAIADDDREKADNIHKKIFNDGYLTLGMLEEELAKKLYRYFKNESEIDEYINLLAKEDYEFTLIVIKYDLFYEVEKLLKKDI